MDNLYSKEEYNKDPVFYCSYCLSLKIRELGAGDFCEDCGSTDISSSFIEDWEKKYEERYKHKFIQ